LHQNIFGNSLVDLAGSEKASQTNATGDRFREGCAINTSLSALSLVIKQLSEGEGFVNFRDSKLTHILRASLGGNARTAIICNVTPTVLEETSSTLKFASSAKTVQNQPHVNEVLSDQVLVIFIYFFSLVNTSIIILCLKLNITGEKKGIILNINE
jgi:hypothetical protein